MGEQWPISRTENAPQFEVLYLHFHFSFNWMEHISSVRPEKVKMPDLAWYARQKALRMANGEGAQLVHDSVFPLFFFGVR